MTKQLAPYENALAETMKRSLKEELCLISYYPDFIYKQGREKVLQHFLNMERIFKTDHFYLLYEVQAKKNLKRELEQFNQ